MTTHTIRLRRTTIGELRTAQVGTDALNALASIPGVEDRVVIEESETEAVIQFQWSDEAEAFMRTSELLREYGLEIVNDQ